MWSDTIGQAVLGSITGMPSCLRRVWIASSAMTASREKWATPAASVSAKVIWRSREYGLFRGMIGLCSLSRREMEMNLLISGSGNRIKSRISSCCLCQ